MSEPFDLELPTTAAQWVRVWMAQNQKLAWKFQRSLNRCATLTGFELYEELSKAADLEILMRLDGDCPISGGPLEELRQRLDLDEEGLTEDEHAAVERKFEAETGTTIRGGLFHHQLWDRLVKEEKAARSDRGDS